MTFESKSMIDDVDWKILNELQQDARKTYREIGCRVGLSSPAVVERIRKMEDLKVINGYKVEIGRKKLVCLLQP